MFANFPLILLAFGTLAGQFYGQVDAYWYFNGQSSSQASGFNNKLVEDNLKGEAFFDLEGVRGYMRFRESSDNSSITLIEYDLIGLKGNNNHYHVHVKPVPQYEPAKLANNATALAQLCSQSSTGGHLNPFNIKEKIPAKSAPFDKYEVGDLSGKHGPLQKCPDAGKDDDRYKGVFKDDTLPLFGDNGIVGRSIVIHKNDGSRWVCATIDEITS